MEDLWYEDVTLEDSPEEENELSNEPVSEKEYLIYFDNFIAQRQDDYYCNVCNRDFISVSAVKEHLNDSKHMSLVLDKPKNQELDDDSMSTDSFSKLLVTNNIFRHDLLLKCYSCKVIIESYSDALVHIFKLHSKLEKAKESAEATINRGAIPKKVISVTSTQSQSDLKDDFIKCFDNFIEKHGDQYLCYLCKIKLLSLPTVQSHMNQEDHKHLLTVKRTENKIKGQSQRDPNRCKLLVENGIFQSSRSSFWCEACQCELETYKVVKKHSLDQQHQEKLDFHFNFKLSSEKDVKRPWISYQKFSGYDSVKQESNEVVEEEIKEKVVDQKYPDYINVDYKEDDEKKLTCFICTGEFLWKKHKITVEHNLRKQFFLNSFVDTPGERVLCILCKATVSKGSVIEHANEHQLMPWYVPPDEFILYFKNFVQPMGRRYYCYLCDRAHSRWYLSLKHTNNVSHVRTVRKAIREIDINKEELTPEFCQELTTNGIFPINHGQLRCWACQYVINSYNEAYAHITSQKHVKKLKGKISKINSRGYKSRSCLKKETILISEAPVIDRISTSFEDLSHTDQDFGTGPKEDIIVLESRAKTIKNDLQNPKNILKSNEELLKSLGLEEEIFFKCFKNFMAGSIEKDEIHCYLCDKFRFTVKKALKHFDDERHHSLKQYNIQKNNIFINKLDDPKNYKLYFKNHIIPFRQKALKCVECSDQFLKIEEVNAHIKTREHDEKVGLKRYGQKSWENDPLRNIDHPELLCTIAGTEGNLKNKMNNSRLKKQQRDESAKIIIY